MYATDNSIYQLPPDGVVVAENADHISAVVEANRASGSPRPLTARGAGTGTNGQSLTDGLIIDTKRQMNQLLELDVDARTVRVEPGMVTAQLNEQLASHGLFWPPSTSTVNRATVGGMISTDAAGKGSLLHGRTSRHVIGLDVVLDDGTQWAAAPVTVEEAETLAGGDGRVAAIWRALLDVPTGPFALPELARGFSGYGIDRIRRDGLIDPLPVLCGAEGTLAIITAATLALTPLPKHNVLVVAAYRSFDDALVDSLRLRHSRPTAIETFDETTLSQGRGSTAWPTLEPALGSASAAGSLLLLEYTGKTEPDVSGVETLVHEGGLAVSVTTVTDPAVKTAAWKVRADAVGLLAKVAPGAPRPTAFVEDCAVPVEEMPAFIAGFRSILDGHSLRYGMFGHADVGCVHVRPALDMNDPLHEELVSTVTAQVVELLAHHGGILWGEHGRGVRGQFADEFLDPSTVAIMRQLKGAFDPTDRFNPGKLYRPATSTDPLLTIDGVPTRAAVDRTVPVEIRSDFASAFSCNGNGLCHHYSPTEVMCPSFKATGDPVQAPKGRADLLRSWLAGEENGGASEELTEQVATTLNQCLSCAACTGRCPVQVDIPELKSRFFDRYHRTRKRPLAHAFLSRFEELSQLAAIVPPLTRLGAKLTEARLGLVDLPTPKRASIRLVDVADAFDRHQPTDIAIVPDVFTSTFEPDTLVAAVNALDSVGYTVSIAPFVPSGKFDHVKGNRARFARAAERQKAQINTIVGAGAIPVVIDPAVALLYEHEYPAILPTFPTGVVRGLADVLAERADQLPTAGRPETVQLFGHCTERSLAPQWVTQWKAVLEAAGHTVEVVETTCCGMAGIFGHEVDNQTVSRQLFDMGWRDRLASGPSPVATGWSCRSQTKRFGSVEPSHPVTKLF